MVSSESRSSAWTSFDGRNRQELNIGDRWVFNTVEAFSDVLGLKNVCNEFLNGRHTQGD